MRWLVRFLAAEMLRSYRRDAEWDVHVNYTIIMRRVFRCGPEYERWLRRRVKPAGSSWRVDEAYIWTRPKTRNARYFRAAWLLIGNALPWLRGE
jgi:transposase-like protein